MAPPWPEPARHPNEDAIVAAAMATAAPPDDVPAPLMNRVDAWWSAKFPPFSTRRLVFGLAALPVIGALQELLLFPAIGWRSSLPRFLFVCIAGGAMLAVAWLPGMREMAERLAKARGTRSPWRWSREPTTDPPPPPIETNFRHDFLVALPFAFVIMLVISATVAGLGNTFAPTALVTSTVGAVFTATLVALRTSVWGLVLFSIAGGVLGGFGLVVLSMMTFGQPSWAEFALGWVLGSGVVFAYGYPVWQGLRNLEARGFRLPMWIVMGGSVILVTGAALVFVAER